MVVIQAGRGMRTHLQVGRPQDQLEEGAAQGPRGLARQAQVEAPVCMNVRGAGRVGSGGVGWLVWGRRSMDGGGGG